MQATYDPFNAAPPAHVVLARRAGVAIGCGGLARLDAMTVELKRMFVLATERGSGVARAILREPEVWASELGARAIVLETGARQPEALALYAVRGYQRIAPYGPYAALPTSICMRKHLP